MKPPQKKAGKSSYGLGAFYSSLLGKVVNAVSFLGASLVNVQSETSLVSCTQLIKPAKTEACPLKPEKAPNKSEKRKH
jgi:hypothetical protein